VRASDGAALSANRLADYRHRYDALIAAGKTLKPPPLITGERGRPAVGPAGLLLARFHTHRDDVRCQVITAVQPTS
jgi:hypothetical protein